MSGKKRLMQSIAVAGLTGVLAFTASFSQVPNLRSEEMIQIAGSGRAGVVTAFTNEEVMNVWTKDLTLEQTSVNQVGASGIMAATYEMTAAAADETSEGMQELTQEAARDGNTESGSSSAEETVTKVEAKNGKKTEDKEEASEEKDSKKETQTQEPETKEVNSQKEIKTEKTDTEEVAKKTADSEEKTEAQEKSDVKEEKEEKSGAKEKEEKTDVKSDVKEEIKKETKEKTDVKEETKEKSDVKEEQEPKDGKKANNTEKTVGKKAEKINTESKKDVQNIDENKEWLNKLMASVKDFLYVRKAAGKDSEIIGKLRKGDVAKIIKKGKVWTKIKSGSLTGYVKNDFCVFGEKAYKLAKKICDTYATVETSGLRVRTKTNKKSNIIKILEEGDKLVVNTDTEVKDGWVSVNVGDEEGYVSEDYVTVALGTDHAISLAEEQKMLEEQKKAEAAQKAVSTSVQNAPAAASSSELTLLAAIIYCEAGGESYTGQVAVGAVVLNRVRSGSFPGSIASVIQQSGQFSPVASGAFSSALANGYYQNCISAAQAALSGSDPTGGALYFHRYGGGGGLVIGHHVFY